MGFRDNVIQILNNQGLKQSDLADILGKSRQNISLLLKNDKPSMQTLEEFARGLGVSVYDLINDTTVHAAHPKYSVIQRFKEYIDAKKYNLDSILAELNIDQKVFDLMISRRIAVNEHFIQQISERFPGINLSWLLTGSGEMLSSLHIEDRNLQLIKAQGVTEFRHLGQDRYLVLCPLVRTEAIRAYIDNLDDTDFASQLQKHVIAVDDLQFGEYMSFETPIEHHGGSVEDFIGEGWITTGKKIEKSTWKRGISFRKYPTYIVVVKHGILLLHVTDYDRDKQAIRFSGPENEHYPNDLIPFDDILELYSVVAITDPRK